MAEEMVARFLGKHCPTTRQLAAFVATRSKELPAEVLARILQSIHKDGVDIENEVKVEGDESKSKTEVNDAGSEYADGVQKDEGGEGISHQKETIMRFLAFTNFPEQMRLKMVETFFEQAI